MLSEAGLLDTADYFGDAFAFTLLGRHLYPVFCPSWLWWPT